MDLHSRLKLETQHHHSQIEQAPLLKSIMDNQITLYDYQSLIKKFYGYIAPCEKNISQLPISDILKQRIKSPLLEQDLAFLGFDKDKLQDLETCKQLPSLGDPESILGYFYVIEGSTLGGQYISKMLAETLGITHGHGANYFTGHGKDTKKRWDEFCQFINTTTVIDQQNKIIASANLTYSTLYQWMVNA